MNYAPEQTHAHNEQKNNRRKRREYLVLPSGVRGLETEKSDRDREQILRTKPHQYSSLYCNYACFARRQTMANTRNGKASPSAFESFLLVDKAEQDVGVTLFNRCQLIVPLLLRYLKTKVYME